MPRVVRRNLRPDTHEYLERRRRQYNRKLVGIEGNHEREEALLAEGDSWFTFPGTNIIRELRYLGYKITSVAGSGDQLQDMVTPKQLAEMKRKLTEALKEPTKLDGILLSGGGNDLLAKGLDELILPKNSSGILLNAKAVKTSIDEIKETYAILIHEVSNAYSNLSDTPVPPIFVHGYDYAVPDSRGIESGKLLLQIFESLGIDIPGPWLGPVFKSKGYNWGLNEDMRQMCSAIEDLVENFNAMLEELADGTNVRYINLRGMFPYDEDHRDYWQDELHPTRRGFQEIMIIFDRSIQDAVANQTTN